MNKSDGYTETKEALSRELKSLKERCVYACNVIENSRDIGLIPNNIEDKSLNYVEALRTEIETSSTAITSDINLLTSQFLSEMREKTEQVEELIAFTKGSIHDLDAEIERLKNLVTTAQEVRSRPRPEKKDIQPQHIQRAKARFHVIKKELHGLVQSLYPNSADSGQIKEVLGLLMQERQDETSNGYIQITSENVLAIDLFKDMNVVCTHPYKNTEVKLDY